MPASSCICLIRGINVGGRNMVPMAELRQVCADLGWADVHTYIQSGNLIFRSASAPRSLEDELERAVERRFGVAASVLVRTAAEWQLYMKNNPYADACRREPNLVMLALSKALPRSEAVSALRSRASSGERVERVGDALWIHYPAGAGRSKLSPGLLDRFVGSPVTTRNWRTVVKLGELAAAQSGR